MKNLLFFLLFLTGSTAVAQTPLHGVLTYSATISLPDTNVVLKSWNVRAYTNDTIVRIETETYQLGTQVFIRHMALGKAYLLLNYENVNYAIQTSSGTAKKDSLAPEYTIKKKRGTKTIAGIKCKKYLVTDKGQPEGYICWFAKKISNKYIDVYPEVKGLAVDYYLPSPDGLIHYELKSYNPMTVNRDLFGIPSDYKKITFDDFVQLFSGNGE